ncbi:hypothetical protein ACFLQ8_00145 [Candidatus Auribacterota bacterium]
MGFNLRDIRDRIDERKHRDVYFFRFGKGRIIVRVAVIILFALILGLIYGRFVRFMDTAADYESARYRGDISGRIIRALPVVKGNVRVTQDTRLKLGSKVDMGGYSLQVVGGKKEVPSDAPGTRIGVTVPGETDITSGEYGLKHLREKRKSYWRRRQERRERRETMGVWQEFSGVGGTTTGEEGTKEKEGTKIKLPGEYDREEWGK